MQNNINLLNYNIGLITRNPDFEHSILKLLICGGSGFIETQKYDFSFLQHYNVHPDAIKLFIEFVRYNDLFIRKNYKLFPFYNYTKNHLMNALEILNELEIIIQWKSLRKYIDNVLQEIENVKMYSPKNPQEDNQDIYDWQYISDDYIDIVTTLKPLVLHKGYTLASLCYHKERKIGCYYRKKKA